MIEVLTMQPMNMRQNAPALTHKAYCPADCPYGESNMSLHYM